MPKNIKIRRPANAPVSCLAVILAISFLLCGWVPVSSAAPGTDSELVMGIFPRREPTVTKKLFTPLSSYLSEQLGRPIRLETTHNFVSFWDNLIKQRYDIVHFNQYHYVRSHKMYGYRVILKNEEFGRSTIASAIFVQKDSQINSIADLKGKKIVFGGGKTAMQSYITARYLLKNGGLNQRDYITVFAINPFKAVLAAYYQQASAAAAGDTVPQLPKVRNEIDTSELKTLVKSPAYAQLPWAVKGDMDLETSTKIQSILSGMKESSKGREVLKKANLTDLVTARDEEYDPHREIIRSVLDEKY